MLLLDHFFWKLNGVFFIVVGSGGDPWGGDPTLHYQSENQQNSGTDAALANGEGNIGRSRQLKTPESFLGENSSLVNLDNLMMSSTKSAIPGIPPKTSKNRCIFVVFRIFQFSSFFYSWRVR